MSHQIAGVGLAAIAGAAADASTSTAAVLLGAAWLGWMLPDADRTATSSRSAYSCSRSAKHPAGLGRVLEAPRRELHVL
jgi:hypothetical protein